MIKQRGLYAGAVAIAIAALAACGGGGGGGSSSSLPTTGGGSKTVSPTSTPTISSNGYVTESVTITLPKGTYISSAVRKGQNSSIPTGTAAISFLLLQNAGLAVTGATASQFGLTTANTADCSLDTSQDLVCVLPLQAPVGQDVFEAYTYDANGNQTGSGVVALTVAQNATNTATITLNANVANVLLIPSANYLGTFESCFQDNTCGQGEAKTRGSHTQSTRRVAQGTTGTYGSTLSAISLYVIALDANNNAILNPANYNSPVYVQQTFDNFDNNPPTTSMSVLYGANDQSPCTAGATAQTTGYYGSLQICSPADQITVSLVPNLTNASDEAYFVGWTSASELVPTPAPSAYPDEEPTGLTNNFTSVYINYPTGGTINVGAQ